MRLSAKFMLLVALSPAMFAESTPSVPRLTRAPTVTAGGLVVASGHFGSKPDRVLFGMEYSGGGKLSPITLVQSEIAAKSKGKGPVVAPPPAQDIPIVARPLSLDYGKALARAPIEMQVAGALVVQGKFISTGQSIVMDMPLSTFTGTIKKTTQLRAGAKETTRLEENDNDLIVVVCTFKLISLSLNTATFQVLPDPHYPAQENLLSVRLNGYPTSTN